MNLTPPDEISERAHIVDRPCTCNNLAVFLRDRGDRVRATCSCGKECCTRGHLSDSASINCWEAGE